jgi:hypothetical protein
MESIRAIHSRARRALLAPAFCLVLAACGLTGGDKPPPPSRPAEPHPSPAAATRPVVPPPPPRPATQSAKPTPSSPDELVGLSEDGVRKLLGGPVEARADGAARILAYRAGACALDVILFMDVTQGELRVLSYDLKSPAAHGCYASLRAAP